jgi:hypothetical protein
MKRLTIALSILVITAFTANATIWRVNNTAGVSADFSSVDVAHSSANPGDTLYLEPSATTYGNLSLSKRLVIIGNGYFTNENPETQADINYSNLEAVTFNPGSQGSVIQGCKIYYIGVNTSEILIQRNFVSYNNESAATILFNSDNISNIIIRGNYLENTFSSTSYPYPTSEVIKSERNGVNNVIISNNLIKSASTSSYHRSIILSSGFSGIIENNVVYGNGSLNNSVVNNNIWRAGGVALNNCSYNNNIGSSTQFGEENGNQSNITMESVFVNQGSPDGQWQLKEFSPAIGAGVGGVDCGAFDGNFPYVLSGIPPIPAIYEFNRVIDYNNQQIEVEISVKSNN